MFCNGGILSGRVLPLFDIDFFGMNLRIHSEIFWLDDLMGWLIRKNVTLVTVNLWALSFALNLSVCMSVTVSYET